MDPTFIHLRVHSEYSLIDGIVRVKPYVTKAVQDHMPALGITDQNNLFATVKFYRAAINCGIKPIIGADLWVRNPDDEKKPFLITLLCQNNEGYRSLTRLVSKAYIEGQSFAKPMIQASWLEELNTGLIALSGGLQGFLANVLLHHNKTDAEKLLKSYQSHFQNRFYIEVQRVGKPREEDYIKKVLPLAEKFQIPIVATNDIRFLEKEDFDAHETRVAIHDGFTLTDPKRPKFYTEQQYFRTQDEMKVLFHDIPAAITNTVEIAKRCNLEIQLDTVFLPEFPVPESLTTEKYLEALSREGLDNKLHGVYSEKSTIEEKEKIYKDRLKSELNVINKMGYAGYFLIVADFIRWAKKNKIPVGPGRGSGAGSLVAYVLDITDLDPLQYDLLFERFLNPERVSMPDFDIDFCMEKRDQVIDYVAKKYGRKSVSQIITFGTMAARAVVRDVGRVLGHPYGFVDQLAKLIPFEIGITLDKAIEQEEDLRRRYHLEDEVKTLIDLARKLEGIARNAGKHAGGVVIAPSALTDFTPLYCEESGQNLVTQFDKDDVESVGLIKFDFLGLRTLTIIDWALQTVNQIRQAKNESSIDIGKIPLNCSKTFNLLKACATTAVFQLESRGMKDLVKRLQPDCFEDIIALVALFRPGPLQSGMVDDFINRKHGRADVDYFYPSLEPILRPTYGVILYQEQVMQIGQVLAGYSLGGADLLRRAMGKKKPEEMAKQRSIFLKGAKKNNINEKLATHIFNLMEKFAGYGFNKSHSAAYALVAYQTAWLKAHYPEAFMAAVLSSDMDHTDKVVNFIDECRQLKIKVIPPDINQGFYQFTVNSDNHIVYGLGAIKGVGQSAVESIIKARENEGVYLDLFDFCKRVESKKLNRRTLESLIKAGSFDRIEKNRAALMGSVDKAMKAAEQYAKDADCGQQDLFGQKAEVANHSLSLNDSIPWNDDVRLNGEKETLGLYLTGHPIQQYQNEFKQFTTSDIAHINTDTNQNVLIAGLITAIRTMFTKRGDRMAFVTLEDQSGRLEIAIFSDLFLKSKDLLVKDEFLIVEGEVSIDDYTGGHRLLCRHVYDITQAREHYCRNLMLRLEQSEYTLDLAETIKTLIQSYQGGSVGVCMQYTGSGAQTVIRCGSDWQIKPQQSLLQQLRELLGVDNVFFCY